MHIAKFFSLLAIFVPFTASLPTPAPEEGAAALYVPAYSYTYVTLDGPLKERAEETQE
jgi:hypothetical protein